MKYFLYLGPRPKFDRFTYWEKFDYLAVFWGVAMIGLSGLMLWFPGFFAKLLPGWVLNAAYIIHSDEALLATGFIFLFHFFHTHLRPEAFPMDPVIFTGSMPLERFKEERPLEYERLVANGQLDRAPGARARAVEPDGGIRVRHDCGCDRFAVRCGYLHRALASVRRLTRTCEEHQAGRSTQGRPVVIGKLTLV